jgi:hypothetical protein
VVPRKPFEPDPGHAGEGTGRFPHANLGLSCQAHWTAPFVVAVGNGLLTHAAVQRKLAKEFSAQHALICFR